MIKTGTVIGRSENDYFSENFDENQNCKNQQLVKELKAEGKCATENKGDWYSVRHSKIMCRPFCASHTLDAPLRTHMARS